MPDDEIDRLYQLPLAEFTAARNALAKQLGSDGGAIRSLEKPNIAAWAVNQLYWHRRPVFNRLVAAAEARRQAHAKVLKGRGGDVSQAEQAHTAAVRAAATEIRALLADTGHEPSSATMNAVGDTLQALPGSGRPGRLSAPLQPIGFAALAGLVPAGERALQRLSASRERESEANGKKAASPAADAKREERARRQADAERRRELAATEKLLKKTRLSAKQSEAALVQAQRALARVKQDRDRLQDQLQFAVKQIDDRATEVREAEHQLADATHEVERLATRVQTLRDGLH